MAGFLSRALETEGWIMYLPVVDDESELPPKALSRSWQGFTAIAGLGGVLLVWTFLGMVRGGGNLLMPLAGVIFLLLGGGASVVVRRMETTRRDLRVPALLLGLVYTLGVSGGCGWVSWSRRTEWMGALSFVVILLGVVTAGIGVLALAPLGDRGLARWLVAGRPPTHDPRGPIS